MHRAVLMKLAAVLIIAGAIRSPASAGVKIYGGPVQSAPGGRYYPPSGYFAPLMFHQYRSKSSKTVHTRKIPLDLNPHFIPGNAFTLPGYVPHLYPQSSYIAPDYLGYFSRSANENHQ